MYRHQFFEAMNGGFQLEMVNSFNKNESFEREMVICCLLKISLLFGDNIRSINHARFRVVFPEPGDIIIIG